MYTKRGFPLLFCASIVRSKGITVKQKEKLFQYAITIYAPLEAILAFWFHSLIVYSTCQ